MNIFCMNQNDQKERVPLVPVDHALQEDSPVGRKEGWVCECLCCGVAEGLAVFWGP